MSSQATETENDRSRGHGTALCGPTKTLTKTAFLSFSSFHMTDTPTPLLGDVLRALTTNHPQLSREEKFQWQKGHVEKTLKEAVAVDDTITGWTVYVRTDPRYYYEGLEKEMEAYLTQQRIKVYQIPDIGTPYEQNRRTSGSFALHCDWSGKNSDAQ